MPPERHPPKNKLIKTEPTSHPTPHSTPLLSQAQDPLTTSTTSTWSLTTFSSPTNHFTLPHLSPLSDNADTTFHYMGRPVFRTTYEAIMDQPGNNTFILGTRGSGKSSILAAMTSLLISQGEHVVYIRDCGALLDDKERKVEVLRGALLVAFQKKPHLKERIAGFDSLGEVVRFCGLGQSGGGRRMLFVFDQFEKLQETDVEDRDVGEGEKRRKKEAMALVRAVSGGGRRVFCSSGNRASRQVERGNLNEKQDVEIWGGFNEEETKSWWTYQRENSGVVKALHSMTRIKIEKVTGCVPSFLALAIAALPNWMEGLRNEYTQALQYADLFKPKPIRDLDNDASYNYCSDDEVFRTIHHYRSYLESILASTTIPDLDASLNLPSNLDHRFFHYNRLTRTILPMGDLSLWAAQRILLQEQKYFHLELASLQMVQSNPGTVAALESAAEGYVVASIAASKGMKAVDSRLDGISKVVLLDGMYPEVGQIEIPRVRRGTEVTMFIPNRIDSPPFDCLLLHIHKMKATLFVVKARLGYTDETAMEVVFFRDWFEGWARCCEDVGVQVEVSFVWVWRRACMAKREQENESLKTVISMNYFWTEHPEYTKQVVSFESLETDLFEDQSFDDALDAAIP